MKVESSGLMYLSRIGGQIVVPFFQRQYVWKQEQWKRLLDNLLEQDGNQTHFLGSVIIQQENTGAANKRIVKLIDGQQRLTTLSILVKVLLDLLPSIQGTNTTNHYPVYLEDILLLDDNNTTPSIRIHHSHIDKDAYNGIMKNNFTEKDFKQKKKDKDIMPLMHQCYQYFYEQLQEHLGAINGDAKIISLINFLISSTDTQTLVFIELDENDNAQEIFDTINSTGVRLNTADIIKNALFEKHQKLGEKHQKLGNNTISFYDATWKKTFEDDKATVEAWDGIVNKGISFIDNFFYCFAVIENKGEINLRRLADFYKEKIKNCDEPAQIEELIEKICHSANQYHELFIEFYNNKTIKKDDKLQQLLLILKELKTTTFHPFILDLYIDTNKSSKDKDELYHKLSTYYIRHYLTGESSKNYNKLAIQFLKETTLLDNYSKKISDDDLMRAVVSKNFDNPEASLLLFFIELSRRTDNRLDYSSFTLEHIMPQKWKSYWPLTSNTKENNEKRDAAIHLLGNMTLLEGALNNQIQNYDFKTKMEGGINAFTTSKITYDDLVKPYLAGEQTTWDEERIYARTKALAQEIIAIW